MSVTSETELIFSSSALTLNHKQICRSLAQFSDQDTPSEVWSSRDLNPGHQCEKLQHFHCATLPIQKLYISISDIVSHQIERNVSTCQDENKETFPFRCGENYFGYFARICQMTADCAFLHPPICISSRSESRCTSTNKRAANEQLEDGLSPNL